MSRKKATRRRHHRIWKRHLVRSRIGPMQAHKGTESRDGFKPHELGFASKYKLHSPYHFGLVLPMDRDAKPEKGKK